MDTPTIVTCHFCGVEEDLETAPDAGWIPYFYREEKEFGPVCPDCAAEHLQVGPDSEYEFVATL